MRAVSSEEPTSVVVGMVPTVAGEKACFAEIQAQYHTQQTVSEATQRLGDQEQLSITREKLHDSILSRMVPEFPAIRDGVLAAKTDGFPAVTTAGGIYFHPPNGFRHSGSGLQSLHPVSLNRSIGSGDSSRQNSPSSRWQKSLMRIDQLTSVRRVGNP